MEPATKESLRTCKITTCASASDRRGNGQRDPQAGPTALTTTPWAASRLSGGLVIDLALGDLGQEFVGLLLFGQGLVEQLAWPAVSRACSPRSSACRSAKSRSARPLGSGQQAGIERRRARVLVHDLLAFVENALDRVALFAARRLPIS